jgi:hypothetical protein
LYSSLSALCGASLLTSGDKGFNPALKDAALKEHLVLALKASNSDIRPEPDYLPLIATAGVLLLEANHVTQFELHNHCLNTRCFYLKKGVG